MLFDPSAPVHGDDFIVRSADELDGAVILLHVLDNVQVHVLLDGDTDQRLKRYRHARCRKWQQTVERRIQNLSKLF